MKYAIVEDGGKQFKAVEGGTIDVDCFAAEPGEQLDLKNVLLVRDGDNVQIGAPFIAGATVQTTVVEQIKGPKLIIFKYRPKKRYRVKTGHRQKYTRLQIDLIKLDGEG
jgi:large subunit ribosomal protein L21